MTPIETHPAARSMPRFPEFVALMASMMALTALSVDIMLPALPQIHADFGLTGDNQQQLVVTSYLLGFAFGQFFHGPLSDRYGRRAVLLAGIAVYAAAAFACLIAGSFEHLLAARFVQGLANAAPRIIAIAVIRDIYGGRRMAEVMSFVMMVFIIVPVIAPSIGSLFLFAGSWHLIFAFLTVCAAGLLVWVAIRLPETHPAETRVPMTVAWLVGALHQTVTTRQTLGYTLATGTFFGALMGYVSSAQQVFADVYGIVAWFPLLFGAVAAALALAAFLNSRFVMRWGMRRIGHGAMFGFSAAAALHLALYLGLGTPPPLVVFLSLLAVCLFCFGLIMPNFNSLAMEPMGRIAGTASSFVGAVTTGIGATFGWLIGQQFDGTPGPILVGFALLGLIGPVIVIVTEKGRLFHPGTHAAGAA